ncbi:Ribosome biogenesis ATPase rix7 [Exophiala xenobiotica]|uniref:Ribosome biogenesis ATPase rix7 n=1 Tax=Lithohypha guttulata TaxID=1690604 RepID=A0ABR0K084_9EURO|nr:Ribosome biogenesis ATPase rix7 [Lithohypha guttulata]KAK5310379.1 Ribosome biogenesis ATPase rix7 [Exophiala xenobiotica]
MAHRHRGGRLAQGLDREVYTVVRKIMDERAQYGDDSRMSFAQVYDEIRGSNSSLNRRPKKLLEDSIERVLDSMRGEEADEEEEALDAPGAAPSPVRAGTNGLNRSIVGAWSTATGVPARSGSVTQNPASKRDQKEKDRERQVNGEPVAKRRKTEKSGIDRSCPTHVSFDDMGGIEYIAEELIRLLALPMERPDYFTTKRVQPTRGILLHGPPGCGKTMLANALAAELQVNFISISAPSIVSGMSGESEKTLRDHFEEAKKCAPCLMFIDEIDAVTPKRENAQREMEKRIVAQLLTCMDDLDLVKTNGKPVVVLAATNRLDSLDPGLRRGGRFDKEILMPVPTEKVREQILRSLTRDWDLSEDVDFTILARRTPGCVGADLRDLVDTTVNVAMNRYLDTIQESATQDNESQRPPTTEMEIDSQQRSTNNNNPVLQRSRKLLAYLKAHKQDAISETTSTTMSDFLSALPQIQPSALREGFATIPNTSFSDVGALNFHITTLRNTLINPILNPTLYASMGINSTAGILLWGPPGNGKTLLAKAVANASHANFISVKGPELLNKYVGESERSVRTLFSRARSSVPVIIFFDELDALVPRRDGANSEASSRVVNTLLTELDGVGASREGIYIVAATNRPDIIDPAMLRPGRLETLLYVGLPGTNDRVEILRTLTKRLRSFAWTDAMNKIAQDCVRFSGADLESLVRQASFAAIERCAPNGEAVAPEACKVTVGDFLIARAKVQPSVSEDEQFRFTLLQKELGTA